MERTGFEQWKPREVARLLALVETERRYYQEMVAALPVALAVLGPDRIIASTNRAFRHLVDLTGDALRGRSIEQIFPSDELIERIRLAHAAGDTEPFSISIGERRFRMAAIPIRSWEDENQSETLLMVEPAEAFAEAAPMGAAPMKTAPAAAPPADLSALPAVIWQADAETFAFTYASGAAEDILGYSTAHWLAEPLFFSDRIHPEDRAEVMALYQSTAASGGEASAEFRALNAEGDSVWLRETIRVPAPGEGSRRISGVTTMIGERRRLEAQALEAGRVDALRGLASRLAHDLNNPLMIVSGYTEELLSGLPPEAAARSDLAEILAASQRIAELAGNLLAFTRLQARSPAKIDVSEVLGAVEPRLRQAAHEVEIAFPEGAVWTFADAEQLAESIAALAAFALASTQEAWKASLTCGTARIAERIGSATLMPGLYARIEIHAPGHPSTAAQKVFESILPVSGVTRAYLDIHQWGGDVVFASQSEEGVRFTVYLPHAEAPYIEPVPVEPFQEQPTVIPAEVEPASPLAPEPEQEPSLGTILVVEDEPGIRGLVRKILRREGYEVLEAGSAEEALTEADAEDVKIDLLLTDVLLPGKGGRELAESLAASNPELKVVYVSGFTDDEAVRSGDFPPGSRFLQKPFTLSALVGAVIDALGGR